MSVTGYKTHELDVYTLTWYASSGGCWSVDGIKWVEPTVYRPGTLVRVRTSTRDVQEVRAVPLGHPFHSHRSFYVDKGSLKLAQRG